MRTIEEILKEMLELNIKIKELCVKNDPSYEAEIINMQELRRKLMNEVDLIMK